MSWWWRWWPSFYAPLLRVQVDGILRLIVGVASYQPLNKHLKQLATIQPPAQRAPRWDHEAQNKIELLPLAPSIPHSTSWDHDDASSTRSLHRPPHYTPTGQLRYAHRYPRRPWVRMFVVAGRVAKWSGKRASRVGSDQGSELAGRHCV